jgi:hypothetical protein
MLNASLGIASSFAEKSSIFRSFTSSIGVAISQSKGFNEPLSASLGGASMFSEHTSLFRSLSDSISLSASYFRGRAIYLGASIGSASSFFEHLSLVRSLSGSLSSGSNGGESSSFFRSLSGSWSTKAVYGRGAKFVPVSLGTNFGSGEVLMGRYSCFNCSSNTGYFAFLVIALGFAAFSVYAARQRRQSSGPPTEPGEEKVAVDEEGWETKVSGSVEGRAVNLPKDREGWETTPEG